MKQISIAAVLIGELVDKLLFIPLVAALVYWAGVESPIFSYTAMAIGGTCTTIGAYVAGIRAKHHFIFHGLAVGILTLVISLIRFLVVQAGPEPSAHSLPWEILAWALSIVAGYAGGLVAKIRYFSKSG